MEFRSVILRYEGQSSPQASNAALKITSDRECRTGWPITPAQRVSPEITAVSPAAQVVGGALFLGLQELVVVVGEEVVPLGVLEDVVDPRAVLGVEGGFDAGPPRRRDGREIGRASGRDRVCLYG